MKRSIVMHLSHRFFRFLHPLVTRWVPMIPAISCLWAALGPIDANVTTQKTNDSREKVVLRTHLKNPSPKTSPENASEKDQLGLCETHMRKTNPALYEKYRKASPEDKIKCAQAHLRDQSQQEATAIPCSEAQVCKDILDKYADTDTDAPSKN